MFPSPTYVASDQIIESFNLGILIYTLRWTWQSNKCVHAEWFICFYYLTATFISCSDTSNRTCNCCWGIWGKSATANDRKDIIDSFFWINFKLDISCFNTAICVFWVGFNLSNQEGWCCLQNCIIAWPVPSQSAWKFVTSFSTSLPILAWWYQ